MKVEILRQDADGGKHLELSPPCECCRDIVAFITESNHTVIWSVNNLLIDDLFLLWYAQSIYPSDVFIFTKILKNEISRIRHWKCIKWKWMGLLWYYLRKVRGRLLYGVWGYLSLWGLLILLHFHENIILIWLVVSLIVSFVLLF